MDNAERHALLGKAPFALTIRFLMRKQMKLGNLSL
jgi:hypothetical protein